MIRMSEAQASLFERNTRRMPQATGPRKPRVKVPKDQLPENIVKDQIISFLQANGWTCTRQHVGTYTPYRILLMLSEAMGRGANMAAELEKAKHNIVRVGVKGDPDWRAEKSIRMPASWSGGLKTAHLVAYLEFKHAKSSPPSPEQLEQIRRKNATGTPAGWFDGFDTGRSPFVRFYREHFEPDMPLTNTERRKQEEDDF